MLDKYVEPPVRRRLEALAIELNTWREDQPPVLEYTTKELREVMAMDAVAAHRLSPGADSWDVDFLHWAGQGGQDHARRSWEAGLELHAERPVGYDPMSPDEWQRNRAIRPRARFPAVETFAVHTLLTELELLGTDEIRILVCDGPKILTWLGGWRQVAFRRRDIVTLEAILPSLQRRLIMERDLALSSLYLDGLRVALEAISGAAFVATRRGTVLLANEAAAPLLHGAPRGFNQAIAASIRGEPPDKDYVQLRIQPIQAKGVPVHYLVLAVPATPARERRARELSNAWGLTPRESQVMALAVNGSSNKDIAIELRVGLRTVELHMSRVLAKSGCARRGELTARFWNLDD